MYNRRGVASTRECNMSFMTPGGAEESTDDDDCFDDEDAYDYYPVVNTTQTVSESLRGQMIFQQNNLKTSTPMVNCNESTAENALQFSVQDIDEFGIAVRNEDLAAVQKFVENGMPVDYEIKPGWNALMYACNCGSESITKYLLSNGADPNFYKDRFSPLRVVCALNNKDESTLLQCVKHLISAGADVNTSEGNMTALMFCARDGKKLILDYLIENGAKTDCVNSAGWSALAWAISYGNTDLVKTLLEINPALESILPNGFTTFVDFANDKEQKVIARMLDFYSKSKTFLVDSTFDLTQKPEPLVRKAFPIQNKAIKEQYGDLDTFLNGLRLSELKPLFHAHQIQFSQLLLLNDDDLIKMGISEIGRRKLILEGIRNIHRREWETSSLQITKTSNMSCPVCVSIVANLDKHLDYIRSTVAYIHRAVKEDPQILEKGQDVNDINKLLQHLNEATNHNQNLDKELKDFQAFLNKIRNNVEYKSANLNVERKYQNRKSSPFSKLFKLSTLTGFLALVSFFTVKIFLKR